MSSAATGGGLIFTGDTVGHFRAFDQQNGKVLWDVNLGAEVSGYPVTFAVKGKQYVAVSTGSSLVSGAVNTLIGAKPPKVNAVYVRAAVVSAPTAFKATRSEPELRASGRLHRCAATLIMFPQAAAETSTGNLHAPFLVSFFRGAAEDSVVRHCCVADILCRLQEFADAPHVIGDLGFHRGCDSQRLVDTAEVVEREP